MLACLLMMVMTAWLYPAISLSERNVLIALYNSTSGDNWTDNTNWRKPGDPSQFNDPGTESTWFGITLTADQGNVERIELVNNNLAGPLPAELSSLVLLKILNLNTNQLNGYFPDLTGLTALEVLDLSNNTIGGNLPASLNTLTGLMTINLFNNDFYGAIPDLGGLTNLVSLDLGTNSFGGNFPTWIGNLTGLTNLNLSYNYIEGTIPDLGNLTQLQYLKLTHNLITGTIPASLNQLTNLLELSIGSNNLSGPLPGLGNLTQLTVLGLSGNSFPGAIPTWINSLTALTQLGLSDCQFTGPIPDLSSLTNLTALSLGNNQLTGTIPSWLGSLTNLQTLYLYQNQLTNTIPDLSNLTQLWDLRLNDNQLTGTIPTWIGNLTALRHLYLYNNQLQGPIPSSIGNLTQLWNFQASCNQLEGNIPPELCTLTSLRFLSLVDNKLSGNIPPEIGNLTGLYELRLSGNQLVGSIPGTLINLTNLFSSGLSLAWNGLYTNDSQLASFIDSKHDGNWTSTQTIAPNVLSASLLSPTSVKVTWTLIAYQGDSGGYRVYYSTTPGSGWQEAGTTASKTVNNYTVTGLQPDTTYYFVVETFTNPHANNQNTLVSELSNQVSAYTEAPKTITVISPNGPSDRWHVGDVHPITWSSTGNISNVKIQYTTNDGLTWNTIIASTPNDGSYNWTVSNSPSSICLMYISDAAGTAADYSDGYFTILGPIYVTSPNGYENWEAGTIHNITWSTQTGISSVKIEYTINNGSSWDVIEASVPNTGSYSWTVPNTPSSSCKVRVSNAAVPSVSDTSNYVFTIAAQKTITVTAPNGGENWEVGTAHNITWTSTGSISNVKLEYSTDNGGTWNVIIASTGNSGSYNWTVPNTPSANALVRITDTAGPATDISNAIFTIAAQRTITVTAPNGGENWEGNTDHSITWTSTGSIPEVKLEYSTNSGGSWNSIVASVANTGSYNWTVPNTPSTTALVKVTDAAGTANDICNALFTISAQRTLTVTVPNGGENWEGSTNQNITWTGTGSIPNVKLEYSLDNGGTWNIITASVANTGSYNWTVPNTPSANVLVRVTDAAGSASDASNAVFTIAAQRTLTVTAPNGGENWEIDTNQNITWTSTGGITNVMIEYTMDNGSSWNTVASSTANTGSYNWNVPNTPSANCLVRISDTAGPAQDISNAAFTIAVPRILTVTSPNGGESWTEGTTQAVTWTYTGAIVNVAIYYSANGGASWTTIAASTSNTGSYNWVIPAVDSGNCLVRVSDTASSASDDSNAVFTMWKQPSITVTAPNGGEVWPRYTTKTITWTTTGNITQVKIQYTDNAGSTWKNVVSSTPNDGSHQWYVPYVNRNKTQCLVRIMTLDGTVVDTSNNYFTISRY